MSMRLFFFGTTLFLLASTICAQVPDQVRQQRREFIGGLLQTLIESQLDHEQPQFQPRPGQGRPNAPLAGTRELLQIRQSLSQFSLQCDELVRGLQQAQYNSPQAGVLLADAMQVKAQTDALARYANQIADHRDIVREFRQLDQNWRVLVHRVRQAAGIDSNCLKYLDQIQTIGNEMCSCLGIEPTLNRAELGRLTSAFNLSFQHLLQDIYYDNRNDNRVNDLIEEGQRLSTKFNQASAAIERENYDSIVAIYQDSVTDWRRFVRKLRPLQTERTRRDIQDIESIGQRIHEQLWLPVQLDTEYILDVTRGIESDVNRLFETISLDDLMNCERPGNVMTSAREFRKHCDRFTRSLEGGLESWIWDFQLFSVQWRNLMQHCQEIRQPQVVRRLREINDAMSSLGQLMGQGPVITQQELIELMAQLDQLSTEIRLVGSQNVMQNRGYGRVFRTDFDKRSIQLHDSIHACHQSLVLGRRQQQLNNDLRKIFDHWVEMKQLINQCQNNDRNAFSRLRRDMEPLMVKLQVIFSM